MFFSGLCKYLICDAEPRDSVAEGQRSPRVWRVAVPSQLFQIKCPTTGSVGDRHRATAGA